MRSRCAVCGVKNGVHTKVKDSESTVFDVAPQTSKRPIAILYTGTNSVKTRTYNVLLHMSHTVHISSGPVPVPVRVRSFDGTLGISKAVTARFDPHISSPPHTDALFRTSSRASDLVPVKIAERSSGTPL